MRQTFNDSSQAREWEEKVIRRMGAVKDTKWLNRQNAGKAFNNSDIEIQNRMRDSAKKRVTEGRHNFLGPETNERRVSRNGYKKEPLKASHPFKIGLVSKETNKKRVENGTHNFLGAANNKKRVENGTHHLLGKGMMTVWNCNEDSIVRISTELYYANKDVYFTLNSKKARCRNIN